MKLFLIIFDILMFLILVITGLFFYKSDGKAAKFLTGYNMNSDDERTRYKEAKMCKTYGQKIITMSIPFTIAAPIDYTYPEKGMTFAWILWIILFFNLLLTIRKLER